MEPDLLLGKELYLFFYRYGIYGIFGIFLSTLLTSILLYQAFHFITSHSIVSYKDFINKLFSQSNISSLPINKGRFDFATFFHTIITFFLVVSFFIMIAGFGAYFKQEFNVSPLLGSSILALFCLFLFHKNIEGILKVNSFLIPVLIVLIIYFAIRSGSSLLPFSLYEFISYSPDWKWILDSILYSSYNSILLIPIMIPLRILFKKE